MPGILIVEDEVLVATQFEQGLERLGYTICGRVTTADQAVAATRSHSPDIIVMDIGLPGPKNGFDAAREIRVFSRAPIMFVTGYSDDAMRSLAHEFAPACFLAKPVRIQNIEIALDLLLLSSG